MGEFRSGMIIGLLTAAVIGLALVLILNSGSDEPTEITINEVPGQTTGSESAEDERPVAEDPNPVPVRDRAFRTPTGNIVCSVEVDGVTCGIREFAYEVPPAPADCGLAGWGQFFGVQPGQMGEMVCADGIPASPMSPVLEYGDAVRVGGFECSSATTGIRCLDLDTGHGFDLARQTFQTF